METKEKLQLLAKELNEVLGLDPEISLELLEEKLLKEINEAKTMIEPGDTLSEQAEEILAELDLPEAPESENEKEDSIEAIPLRTQMENAERLKDLRDIAKANDEFKSIRGALTKWKTKMSLIDVMLDVLDDMEGKEMQEKEKVKPEPVTKAKAKKVVATKEKEKVEEKKTISKKGGKKSTNYTRVNSICEAIKTNKNVKSINELSQLSDDLYIKNNTGKKQNLVESKFITKYIVAALAEFEITVIKK